MIFIIGNCQTRCLAICLGQALPDETIEVKLPGSEINIRSGDIVLVQSPYLAQYRDTLPKGAKMLAFPSVVFGGYHPDIILMPKLASPTGGWHSSLMAQAYRQGLTAAQTEGLFCDAVFEAIDFYTTHQRAGRQLEDLFNTLDFPGTQCLADWTASGCFMHGINHTKLIVAQSLAAHLLRDWGVQPVNRDRIERFLGDPMLWSASWPVYPQIAQNLQIASGDYLFKAVSSGPLDMGRIYDLPAMISTCFALYAKADPALISHLRFDSPAYQGLERFLPRTAKRGHKSTPYSDLPETNFWRQAVATPAKSEVDPVVAAKFTLSPQDRIATAGSCFAQHIARHLKAGGFQFLNTEPAPADMPADEAFERQYGLFSARFGNIYTARQLRQTFERAYGRLRPRDESWSLEREDAPMRRVDPFRPSIEPEGYADDAALRVARDEHFAALRQMFETLDVFIFTLGLTEAWRAKADGAVFPLAPGVAGGSFSRHSHEFVNFTSSEVETDLRRFWQSLREVNPKAKMILTVSPVPLAASYEPRHVLVSTSYSKAALRVAAETLSRDTPEIAYFPSYEIITGAHAGNSYFDTDLRSVRPEGVAHVMRLFMQHYTNSAAVVSGRDGSADLAQPAPPPSAPTAALAASMDPELAMNLEVICDEAKIVRA